MKATCETCIRFWGTSKKWLSSDLNLTSPTLFSEFIFFFLLKFWETIFFWRNSEEKSKNP